MKHRLLLLLLFMFVTSAVGWAQKSAPLSFTVKGILLDSLTQEGEPYATIRITKKSAPNKAVKMAVTGANGHFQEKLNVASGVCYYDFLYWQISYRERICFKTIGESG